MKPRRSEEEQILHERRMLRLLRCKWTEYDEEKKRNRKCHNCEDHAFGFTRESLCIRRSDLKEANL